MRTLITNQPIITRIENQILPSTSSFGRWAVTYFIKWSKADKNEIGTFAYFWSKKEAQQWIEDQSKLII